MRILLHDCSGHPFQVQLSRSLAARGHEVRHLYCSSFTAAHGDLSARPDDPDGFSVAPIDLGASFDKYTYHRRLAQEVTYGRRLVDAASAYGPDVMISCNDPLFTKAIGARWCRKTSTPWVFWLQDFFSSGMAEAATDAFGIVGRAPGAAFRRVEARLLRTADHVVAITEDFTPTLGRWNVPSERTTVVENWAPIEDLPVRPKANAWATRHGLDDKVVFLYAGTLGKKHDPAILTDLATEMRHRQDVRVVVCSEGPRIDELKERVAELQLDNIVILPFQPFDELPDVLGAADVLLVILEAAAGRFSVPSKVLTSLCAGRPILGAMPRENLAAITIARSQAGTVVEPDDRAAFLAAAHSLLDPTTRASMGAAARSYAERTFAIGPVTDRFESILERITVRTNVNTTTTQPHAHQEAS
jgi:glycosyltransferase involved in cell wall biosynthesis